MMASSKLGAKPRLTVKPITGTARPGQLQLHARMDEKAKQQLIKQLLQKARAKKSRETARAVVLPAVVDGHPRGEFQPMTENGVLAGWVRKEKGRYAYYDVHGNRTYGFKKPTFTKMGKETGAGEVTLPRGTTKVVAARRWLPILVGGEPKSKLQPVWKDGEVAGWKHDVSGVTKYYDLSGRRTGQDEITIAGTMPPWEYAGLAAGGVRVAAQGATKRVGALLGKAKSVARSVKSRWKALFGGGAKNAAKDAGTLVDDVATAGVKSGGRRASRSGGEIFEGSTWDNLGEGVDAEVEAAFALGRVRSGTMVQFSDEAGALGGSGPKLGQGDIWFHDNMKVPGAGPGGRTVQIRTHSPNPNAPPGSFSRSNYTTQINTTDGLYRLPDGQWKRLSDMTAAERAAAHYPAGN
jgi:hypothetical protein